MRSAIALSEAARGRRLRQASSSRSRTTSDSEIFRLRDSSAMPATNGSGNRTVRVFMRRLYYIASRSAGQTDDQLTHEGSLRLSASSAFQDRKSTRLNSSHLGISYAVFCLKKKKHHTGLPRAPW